MSPEEIRQSIVYSKALEEARDGESIATTVESLLKSPQIRRQINKGTGEWLVTMALVVQQAHIDVSPIKVQLTTFE